MAFSETFPGVGFNLHQNGIANMKQAPATGEPDRTPGGTYVQSIGDYVPRNRSTWAAKRDNVE